jgi:cytochrome c biogenesis protein CcdA/thiol-disulfide isomerase/thioredoxin
MNPVEVGLAFVEGLALIASPCILPVLPLVLSASVTGGRARPYGITLGFVLSFSAFVLAARQIVAALHIDADALRNVSLALLFALGVVMFSERLSGKFAAWTQGLANFGNRFGGGKEGFGGGIAIGALIGLVWTPCAGPILAAVLVQVIRQQTDLQSVFVTLSFALGAALPMLVITLAGKKIMNRFRFIARHAEAARKIFALLILLSVGFLAFGSGAANIASTDASSPAASVGPEDWLKTPYPAPEFVDIQDWLNSPPLFLNRLKGKVVLIDFWTYSCINCVRTLPYLIAWDAKYRDEGLVIIGVHAPEFQFERSIDNIKAAVAKYGIRYPVAIDNNLATWQNFNNSYWPAHYLIDKEGRVVYTHFGEGRYDVTEKNIRYLLGLRGPAEANPITPPTLADETPETYLGYARADRFATLSEAQKDNTASYKPVNFIPAHHWSLGGRWKIESEKIIARDRGALLRLNFKAKKVFLVMGTSGEKPQEVTLKLNGGALTDQAGKDAPEGVVTVTGHALYELINQPTPQNSLLEITAEDPGVEMYAFTFGE